MAEVIKVEHIEKSFKKHKVLKDVSLTCESGKIYGIVGYNGSGKSVLFKCISGFYLVEKGTITVRGKMVGKDMDVVQNLGTIIEEPAFIKQYSGLKNLELLYMINHKKNREYVKESMRKVGLDPELKKPVGKYSLGMKQRLAIAQATMENQDILILDEPMNGLDPSGIVSIRKLLENLCVKNKITIVISSHILSELELLADVFYLIQNGKIIDKKRQEELIDGKVNLEKYYMEKMGEE